MVNRAYVVLATLSLTGAATALMVGHRRWDGPVLFTISETHGVNLGDVPVLACWLAGIACAVWFWRRGTQ